MVRDQVIPWALTGVDLGDDVVEVGPGYGATTEVLQGLVPRLTSVEIDPELAAALIERYAGTDHVEMVEGDATALTFADGRFSGATSFSMLHHVPTPELQDRVFAEARRVLRPGGVFVAVDSLATTTSGPSTRATPTTPSIPGRSPTAWAPPGSPRSRSTPTSTPGRRSPAAEAHVPASPPGPRG